MSDGLLLAILEDLGDIDTAQVPPGQESDDSIGGENDDDDEDDGPGRRGEWERLEIMYCQVGLMMATESGSPTVRESSTRRT